MSVRRAIFASIFLLFALTPAGCTVPRQPATAPGAANAPFAGSSDERKEPVAKTLVKVSVAPFLSYAPFFIALEEGFFTEQGIEIELVRVARASDAIPALAQGQIDAAGLNINSALLNAVARDSGVRMVAAMSAELAGACATNGAVLRPAVAPPHNAGLTTETLRSLRYYVNPTSVTGYGMDAWLSQYNITIDEITLADISGGASVLEPLQQGAVDLAALTEPWITRAEDSGAGALLWSLADVLGNTQTSVIVFGPSLLKDNPGAGERFITAYLQGARQFAAGKTGRNLDILEKHTELDRTLLEKMCFPQVPGDGMILTDSIEAFGQWAAARDQIDAPVTAAMFWEPHFVEVANAQLGTP